MTSLLLITALYAVIAGAMMMKFPAIGQHPKDAVVSFGTLVLAYIITALLASNLLPFTIAGVIMKITDYLSRLVK